MKVWIESPSSWWTLILTWILASGGITSDDQRRWTHTLRKTMFESISPILFPSNENIWEYP
jgi:hypothetical protein